MYYFYSSVNDMLWNIRNWFSKCIYWSKNEDDDEYELSNENEYFIKYDEIWDL